MINEEIKNIGDRVRLTEYFKEINKNNPNCNDHILEFENSEGIVSGYSDDGYTDYLDVKWEPYGLRYGYHYTHLEKINT
jgi:hypothetical protein